MKIRDYKVINTPKGIITIKKDQNHYRSTYSVCFFSASTNVKTTCPNRQVAKSELIRLLQLYTDFTMTQILRIKL